LTARSRYNTVGHILVPGPAILVIIGFPMVYVLWDAVNLLLAGDLAAIRYAIVVPVLALFVALLVVVAKLVRSWEQGT
jgi:hypothetical protein